METKPPSRSPYEGMSVLNYKGSDILEEKSKQMKIKGWM